MRDARTLVRQAATALALCLGAWALGACGGTSYVQPPMPTAPEAGPVLPVRALSLDFGHGHVSVDAGGVMSVDGNVVGTFAETGSLTLSGGNVWAMMDAEGAIHVEVDDPAAAGPTQATFTTSGGRLVRPDGQVLATVDVSGQLVTAAGSFPVAGITSRTARLALFLYLVAATYAEEAAVPASE